MKNKPSQKEVKEATASNNLELNKQTSKEFSTETQKQAKDHPVYKRYSFNGTVGGYQGL
jgi:hypothetical protein